jgi:stress response protein YsnF
VTNTGSVQNPSDAGAAPSPVEEQVIRLLAEQISVERRRVETGRIIATVATHHHEHVIKEVLVSERVEVERVPIGRIVEAVPSVREEGDTTIIPVVEEVLVIERRLVLKEEVHLRRVRVRETHAASVVTRTQDVVVTRSESQPPFSTAPAVADHANRDNNPKERTHE